MFSLLVAAILALIVVPVAARAAEPACFLACAAVIQTFSPAIALYHTLSSYR